MTAKRILAATVVAGLVASAAVASPSVTAEVTEADRPRLIDVPYLPQTEDLCGGAALAMVMRYWGARAVHPTDFSALVEPHLAGIRTDVLQTAAADRGWQSLPFDGAATAGDWVGTHVQAGRPVIALIEVGTNRYHYVVVVAWTPGEVVAHDPAVAPFRVWSRPAFERVWRAAGGWALLLLPGTTSSPVPSRTDAEPADRTSPTACTPMVREMVALSTAGDRSGAAAGLEAAIALCPDDAAAWRELAGVRFLERDWPAASRVAAEATRLAPEDALSWDLLATSRFLNHEPLSALRAWNQLGRPTVDMVAIDGTLRTRHPVVARVLGLTPGSVLTSDRLVRARRRLAALPSAAVTDLRYQPVEAGAARIDVTVVERRLLPTGVVPLALEAARTALHREARLSLSAPTGSGERVSASWRWWDNRPRVTFEAAVPAVAGFPGIMTVDGLWERASYSDGSTVVARQRARAAFGLTDWATATWQWRTTVAYDRWDRERHLAAEMGLAHRDTSDRTFVSVDAGLWHPLASRRGFATARVAAAARTTTSATRPTWLLVGGLSLVGQGAPLDLWAGAGTGRARQPLLRAHPLLQDGVVAGAVFGRQLAHTTVEYVQPLRTVAVATLAAAAFVDTAAARRRVAGNRYVWHTDAGLGVRLSLPGAGTIRLDVARGLDDPRTVVSASWVAPWPAR